MSTDTTKKFKKVRLFKLAKEVNVPIERLVEHLEETGHTSALKGSGVNRSVATEDAYMELLDAFAEDRALAERVQRKRSRRQAELEDSGDGADVSASEEGEATQEPETDAVPETVAEAPEEVVAESATEAVAEPVAEAPVVTVAETVAEPEAEAESAKPKEAVGEAAPVAEPAVEPQTAEAEAEQVEAAAPSPAKVETPVEAPQEAVAEVEAAAEATEEAPEPVAEAVSTPTAETKDEPAQKPTTTTTAKAKPSAPSSDAAEGEDTEAIAAKADTATPPADATGDAATGDAATGDAATGDAATGDAEEDASVLTADRYNLEGTKVIGKIDLSSVEDSGRRKRKRKRKRKTTETTASEESASKKTRKSTSTTKRKRKGGPAVDEADVEQTLQETLRELELGASRVRQRRRRARRDERAAEREREAQMEQEEDKILRVTEFVSTGELANLLDVPVNELISALFTLGMIVSINQRLDADAISFLAEEYGYEVDFITEFSNEDIDIEEDAPEDLAPRAPVITVMGHVDHGKTSLLDYIRNANVVAGEAGGITQHIGAYHITLANGRRVTFLDTPGHEAFTAMRARGAQVTDLVILVVAADDAVMPQTIEAINHAQAADVPLVVAINKIDKANANTQKVMAGLAEHSVLVEPYGGTVQCAMVSAMTGEGVDDLLDKILLEADLLELKANEERNAIGTVIESRLEKGRGNVATVLVQNGSLEVGDAFIAGIYSGRVRAMFDERDQAVNYVGPSQPALILGFNGAPEVGDQFVVLNDDREARDIAQKRQQIYREQSLRQRKHITLDEIGRRLALGDFQELNIIIKGDVMGSIEALSDSLLKLSTEEVQLNIIHSGVGAISESDVMLASASDAVIIGFQVRPSPSAREAAEREEIDIRLYSIIYDAIEDVHDALEGLLSPEESEKILGVAEVRETFKVPKIGTIAGCYVSEGKIHRNDTVRLIRDGVVIYDGVLNSLKRFKDDVREVQSGYECGMGIQNYNDIKVGDLIEAYEIVETRRKLEV